MNEQKRKRVGNNGVATPHDTTALLKLKEKTEKNSPSISASDRLVVPSEEEERITPRAGGRLVVLREEVEDDFSAGEELDLTSGIAVAIRRPGPLEWFRLYRNLELPTKLVVWKPKPDAIDVEYYSVDKELRKEISNELKAVRVLPYFNLSANRYGLWIIKVTSGNSWYESLRSLLSIDNDFFETNQIRVVSEKDSARYRVKKKPLATLVNEPPKPTGEMLGEAIGEDHFIRDRSHRVYQSLTEGEELK